MAHAAELVVDGNIVGARGRAPKLVLLELSAFVEGAKSDSSGSFLDGRHGVIVCFCIVVLFWMFLSRNYELDDYVCREDFSLCDGTEEFVRAEFIRSRISSNRFQHQQLFEFHF